jgi:membrane protein implicated in regulation of membrane protease activity/transcriptional regulator with XRE-family HTH domain
MSFGDRLAEVRRKNALTQEAFAEELKVSRQAVSKWESTRGYPEIEKILYICKRYHVTMDELFVDELPPRQVAAAEEEKVPEELPTQTLGHSLSSFLNNLSPVDKRILFGVVGLLCIGFLWLLSQQSVGGGNRIMIIVWIAAIVLFGVVEALTAGLTSIWFVLGSVAALIVAICNGPIWLQGVLFLLISAVALIVTRPLVNRMMQKDKTATNADRVLGSAVRVTEKVDNAQSTGAVYADGKTWTARSRSGEVFDVGRTVRVVHMEGVKLFVESMEVKQEQLKEEK